MIRIKHFLLFFISLILCELSFSQDDVIILEEVETGTTHTHIARQRIEFRPGYEYSAQQDAHVQAYIDEWLTGNIEYSDTYTDAIFDRNIDVNLSVGQIQGVPSVTSFGGASYSLPIYVSPASNGMEPSVNLQYNSQLGNGVMGMGWSISGLSTISRTGKNSYFDNEVSPISFTDNNFQSNDRFALDGLRLIRDGGGVYGDAGFYKTEEENFIRINAIGGTEFSPDYFKVEHKDGTTTFYGSGEDSKVMGTGQNSDKPLVWRINKVIDLQGNYFEYKYRDLSGESVLEQIVYSKNDSNPNLNAKTIKFFYGLKLEDEHNNIYVAGGEVTQKHLLREVAVESGDSEVRRYELVYSKTESSFLSEVFEIGLNNDQLNSTRFLYENQLGLYSDVSNETVRTKIDLIEYLNLPESTDTYISDFNGDGLSDVLALNWTLVDNVKYHISYDLWLNRGACLEIWGASNNPYFKKQFSGILPASSSFASSGLIPNRSFDLSDYNGDGLMDFILIENNGSPEAGVIEVPNKIIYYSTGTSFEEESVSSNNQTSLFVGSVSNPLLNGDFNGDGATDLFQISKSPGVNDAFKIRIQFPLTDNQLYTASLPMPLDQIKDIHIIDFNGDGKSEILFQAFSSSDSKIVSLGQLDIVDPGGGFPTLYTIESEVIYSDNYLSPMQYIYSGDFNGDRNSDLLISLDGQSWIVAYSDAINFRSISKDFDIDVESADESILISDINGDAKTDIVRIYNEMTFSIDGVTGSGQSTMSIYTSTGNNFKLTVKSISNDVNNDQYKRPLIGDFNGDGKGDVFHRSISSNGYPSIINFNNSNENNCLKSVLTGFNNRIDFEYERLSNFNLILNSEGYERTSNYIKGEGSQFPIMDFQGSFNTVKSVSTVKGDFTSDVLYSYRNAKLSLNGKGLLGFGVTRVVHEEFGSSEVHENILSDEHQMFIPFRVSSFSSSDQLQNLMEYTNFEILDLPFNRFWPRVIETTSNNYVSGETSSTVVDYDSYGNVTNTNISFGQGLESIITTTNYVSCGAWIPSCPDNTIVTSIRGAEPEYTRETDFSYYSNGNLHSNISDPNTDRPVTTEYTYNNLGLVANMSISSPATSDYEALPTKTKTIEYDDFGYPVKEINTNGDRTECGYDHKFGVKKWSKGITGLTTYFNYDSFGNLISETDALGISTHYSTHWDISNGSDTPTEIGISTFYTLVNRNGSPEVREWFDSFGRSKKLERDGFNGNIISAVTNFDDRGNIISQSGKFYVGDESEAVIASNTYYPETNFLASSSNGVSTMDYSYEVVNGLFVSKGESLETSSFTSEYKDSSGKLVKTGDVGGFVETFYHSNGKPNRILVNGQETSRLSYDLLGNQTELVEANSGTTAYKYNAYGELISQTNANGSTTSIFYDEIGRIDYEERVEGTVNYEYETSNNGKNELRRLVGVNNEVTKEYIYDQYSRVLSETEFLSDDNITMTTSYTYDGYGRVATINYPSNEVIVNSYIEPDGDNHGNLASVRVQGQAGDVYLINGINALGQVTDFTLGNGLNTTKQFNKFGMLEHVTTPGIQDMNYSYDLISGNMDYRQNNINGLKEIFLFDDLDRLTESRVVDVLDESLVLSSKIQTYETNGNIDEKSDVGDYDYDLTKFNALNLIEDVANNFDYDVQTITYSSFDKIKTITESNSFLEVFYGPAQIRKKVEFKESDSPTFTRFYGRQYERLRDEVTGVMTELTYLPGGAVKITKDDDITSPAIHYLHSDHQGSVIACSDQSGNLSGKQSYDPWGRKRNPETWNQDFNNNPMPSWLARGYTSHEYYDQFDLVNMNGRTYDPRLGRMIQVDNFVQAPNFTQSHNRYTYAFNNPLKYTDPSGEFIVPVLVGAVAGGYIGGSLQKRNSGHATWSGIVTGAIIGAAVGLGVSATLGHYGVKIDGITDNLSPRIHGLAPIGTTTLAFDITYNALATANINMISNAIQGKNIEQVATSGLVGLVSGGIGGAVTAPLKNRNQAMGFKAIRRQNYVTSFLNGGGDRFFRSKQAGLNGGKVVSNTIFGALEGGIMAHVLNAKKFRYSKSDSPININILEKNWLNIEASYQISIYARYASGVIAQAGTSVPGVGFQIGSTYYTGVSTAFLTGNFTSSAGGHLFSGALSSSLAAAGGGILSIGGLWNNYEEIGGFKPITIFTKW